MKVTKFLAGFYRVTCDETDYFGNVKKKDNQWEADIRDKDGALVRFAGIWKTKKDAVEEVETILKRNWT